MKNIFLVMVFVFISPLVLAERFDLSDDEQVEKATKALEDIGLLLKTVSRDRYQLEPSEEGWISSDGTVYSTAYKDITKAIYTSSNHPNIEVTLTEVCQFNNYIYNIVIEELI